MIKADIALSDLSFDPAWKEGSVSVGDGSIRPHAHAMLETLFVHASDQWFVVVRERQASSATAPNASIVREHVDDETFHRLYRECLLWPLDYVMIEVARAGHRMRIRAGVLGSVPVYCRVMDDRVKVSWDSADFNDVPTMIDAEVASHQLALHTVYSARQIYVGVVMLTERASLHVEPGRASYRYPDAMVETAPSPERGQDTLPAFADALQRVITLRPWLEGATSLELSGGMDSGTVATALTRQHGNVASRGILLDGEVRAPQVQRRAAMIERLGLLDDTVDIAAYPPSLDLRTGGEPYGFYREFYLEACSALWASARAQGRRVLFTGIGGDELFPAYVGEVSHRGVKDPAWARDARTYAEGLLTRRASSAARSLPTFDAPESPVPTTSLLAHACRAPDLLKHGQWPVNPLSDPYLALFCHRLPKSSRQGREVMRRYLQAHLGDDVFTKGYLKETFVGVFPPLIARHAKTLAAQLQECALADLGLVDRQAVFALLDTIAQTQAHAATSAFVSFLSLERCARQAA
ncbi:hypothetical protein L2Y94_11375 [Luteibacter aegosomatis]|uniref:hypothetical protein n=1 Tax=Luteibacter aegosomatis TaxID=2911537 RepID=UPI001FFB3AE6|nr:hypothetical protein [Luteibacter aegosomatis]UPG83960.1 hypothetical protein L2Y94_11375 [Luteibacter aegosomatis]